MRIKHLLSVWLLLAVCLAGAVRAPGGEISAEGQKLAATLDAMKVDQLWLAGRPVNWRTGEPKGRVFTNTIFVTHCSAFAAAAADQLGVYLLHPPDHSAALLANAQQDWLRADGTNQGWRPVASELQAQRLANAGQLVVVTCKNPNPGAPGHIAIVRPSIKSDAQILAEGPQIIQAGRNNYLSTSAKLGFKNHPGAFDHDELLYFEHPLTWPAPADAAAKP
jgi:hypothetical protein